MADGWLVWVLLERHHLLRADKIGSKEGHDVEEGLWG